jgi:hypothetical protein
VKFFDSISIEYKYVLGFVGLVQSCALSYLSTPLKWISLDFTVLLGNLVFMQTNWFWSIFSL